MVSPAAVVTTHHTAASAHAAMGKGIDANACCRYHCNREYYVS
jgi:hypothetical protein